MFLAGRAIVDIPMSGLPNDWPSVQRVVHEGSARLVIITEDGGFEPETPSFAGIGDSAMEEPAVQVRVRGAKGEGVEAEAKMLEIRDALHGRVREAVGYTNYMRVKAQSGVLYIGMDAKERPEFTLSFRARKSIELVS
jgi:hypothetical protein